MGRRVISLAPLAVIFGLAACGDDSSATDDGGVVDGAAADAWAGDGGGGDAAASCGATWELVSTPVTDLQLLDPAPLNAGRPVRVSVTTVLDPCDDIAPVAISFAFESKDALLEPKAWRPIGGDCVGAPLLEEVERPVLLELGPGEWRISVSSEGSTADQLELTVAEEPGGECGSGGGGGGGCTRDCDCDTGLRCLGGNGFGGTFTACARPCELDRDCDGDGACTSVDDGLEYACEPGVDECDGQRPCPDGFTCTDGTCEPDFQLGQATRTPCACDDDCEPGLRCVEPLLPDGERRCEVACQTQGRWCTGAHICGPAAQDLSGLAEQDNVCIWLGE